MDTVKIRIQSEADPRGFDQTEQKLKGVTKQINELGTAIKQGLGIGIGDRVLNTIGQIPAAFQAAIAKGVEFNVKMHDAESAIANVAQQFGNLDKAAAKNAAAGAMQQIVELEPKVAGSLDTLVQGFLATFAASQSVGMSIEQNVALVGKMANALANSNIDPSQLAQEARSIITGNIGADSSLARTIGLTNADVTKAKEAGQLFEMLSAKIGTLGDAGDSFAVRWSSLQSAIDKSLATITKPIFDVLFDSLQTLTAELNDPAVVEGLRSLGFEVAQIAKGGAEMVAWAIRNASALQTLAHGAGTLGAALAAMSVARAAVGMGAWVASLLASKVAVDAETASLAANTAAQRANAGARAGGAAGGLTRGGAGNLALAGIGIGAAIYAYRTQKAQGDTAAAEANDALVDSLEKQRALIEAQVRAATTAEAKAKARAAIEAQIVEIKSRQHLLDGDGQGIASRGIFNLEFLRKRVDRFAGTSAAGGTGLPGLGPVRDAETGDAGKVFAAGVNRSDLTRQLLQLGASPDDIAAQRAGRVGELRGSLTSLLNAKGSGTLGNEGIGQLSSNIERSGYTAEGKSILLEMVKELAELEKEITDESEKRGQAVEEQMQKEAQIFAKRKEALADLQSEQAILAAQVAGDTARVTQLEKQKALRAQIAALMTDGLTEAEATAEATKTQQLREQLTLKERMSKQAAADAQLGVETAGPSVLAQRKAQVAKSLSDKRTQLEADGFTGEALTSRLGAFERAENRRLQRAAGRIGGETAFGGSSDPNGVVHPDVFSRRPLGDQIQTRPANAPEAANAAPDGGGLNDAAGKVQQAASNTQRAAQALGANAGALQQLAPVLNSLASALPALSTAIANLQAQVNRLESDVS